MQGTNWFELWFDYRQNVLDAMIRNMVADLEAGYNINGASITRQKAEIEAYKEGFDFEMDRLKDMTTTGAQKWCYYDLRRRGALS